MRLLSAITLIIMGTTISWAATWNKDMAIANTQLYTSENILCTGNIVVTGKLTLSNSSVLKMNSATDGQYSIIVKNGGELNIISGGTVTANDPTKRYYIIYEPGSKGSIEASTIEYVKDGIVILASGIVIDNSNVRYTGGSGVYVSGGAQNVVISNSTIEANSTGITVSGESSVYIHDNTIKNNTLIGIVCDNSAPIISNNHIISSEVGLIAKNGANPNLGDLTNTDTSDDGGNTFTGQIGKAVENDTNNILKMENNNWGTNNEAEIKAKVLGPTDLFIDPKTIILTGGTTVEIDHPVAIPNPFNPATEQTKIMYKLNSAGPTSIYIFDLFGGLIWRNNYTATDSEGGHQGINQVSWDGKSMYSDAVESAPYILKVIHNGMLLGSSKIIVLR